MQGAEYVLQLKEEKATLNKTVEFEKMFWPLAELWLILENIQSFGWIMMNQVQALRSEAEQLSQEIAEFQAQLPTAGEL